MKFSGVITIGRSDVHATGERHTGQGHTVKKAPIWAVLDCDYSLLSQMAKK